MPHIFTFIPTVTVVVLAFLTAYFVFRSFYYAQVATWLNEDLQRVIKQKFRLGQGRRADPKELDILVRKIMNHKFEQRDNKHTIATARKHYADEINSLFGFNSTHEDVKRAK